MAFPILSGQGYNRKEEYFCRKNKDLLERIHQKLESEEGEVNPKTKLARLVKEHFWCHFKEQNVGIEFLARRDCHEP